MSNVQGAMSNSRPMKDSGVEWIGEIPENWIVRPVKNSFSIVSGATPKSDNPKNWDGDIAWITPADYKTEDQYVFYGKRNITMEGYDSCGTTLVPVGSIVFSKRAPIGTVAIAGGELCTNQGCLSCVPKQFVCSKYFYYSMYVFAEQFNLYGTGTTFKEISFTAFSDFPLPHPPFAEQRRIADFLDRRCAEIDGVIADTKKTIEEYKALKQSIITEAVTKGVRGERPMKDSGIEWIGEIPEEWECKPIKYLASYNDEVIAENTDLDFEFDYIEIGSVEYGKGITEMQHLFFKDAPSRARRIVQANDIIVSTVRTYLKAVAAVTERETPLIASTGFVVIRPQAVNPIFLKYAILSDAIISSIEAHSTGISYPAINASQVVQFKIPLPKSEEQLLIAEYLDEKCGEVDRLIDIKQQLLTELETYKKSVIYEYVTGKRLVV